MNTPDHDDWFAEYLNGSSQLSRRYRATADETPAPELDAAILASADKALRRPRWMQPLALAATVVLGLALLFTLGGPPQPARAPAPRSVAQPAGAPSPKQPSGLRAPGRIHKYVAPSASPALQSTPPPGRAQAAPSSKAEQAPAAPAPRPPSRWLQRIRALLENGERQAATAELEAFRRQYPGHDLPADLRPILR